MQRQSLAVKALCAVILAAGLACKAYGQPVPLNPAQLDQLVARIALYPDSLLAQVLTAATYWLQIPDAARWADEHSYLTKDALAQAIQADNLPWDPSVVALLPFPSVLDMMARDPAWLQQLGSAALTQRAEVMDAIQRMRKKAMDFGYLKSNGYMHIVSNGGYIELDPVDPNIIYVPTYDPVIVFSRPYIAGAIRFGPVTIGAAFAPWGWTHPAFLWLSHSIVIDRHPWERVWVNREVYAHPYARPWVRPVGPRVERHEHRKR
jgi:hypothetical protein